jgi:hypothetical protein
MDEMNNKELGLAGLFFSLIPWLSVLGLLVFKPL